MSPLPHDPDPNDADFADPRPRPGEPASVVSERLRPAVAAARPTGGVALIWGGAGMLGVLAFAVLSTHRPAAVREASQASDSTIAPVPPPPADLAATEAAARSPSAPILSPAIATMITPPTTPPAVILPPAMTPSATLDHGPQDRKAPALVVDLAVGAAAAAAPAPRSGSAPAPLGAAGANGLNGDEQFADRVGATAPERSRATLLRDTKTLIPQGVMIPGVLETALNSDLPGFARAVVSRDVRGFDGSTVLIPRGSRVIGQYKSAVAQGQSRAFVIWTRIIRPDGASIQIGSSGTDALGRAGLDGKVDRHFFEQFSGAIVLSVINAGVASLARAPSTQVVIGSSSAATGLGAQALQPTAISPTIKVAQGAAIRIFVARDLDFSSVATIAP